MILAIITTIISNGFKVPQQYKSIRKFVALSLSKYKSFFKKGSSTSSKNPFY